MKQVYLYKVEVDEAVATHPDNPEFYYTERNSDIVKVGDIVEVNESDHFKWNKSIKRIVAIKHQIAFEHAMEITDYGWRHWMKFEDIQEIRDSKIKQIIQ